MCGWLLCLCVRGGRGPTEMISWLTTQTPLRKLLSTFSDGCHLTLFFQMRSEVEVPFEYSIIFLKKMCRGGVFHLYDKAWSKPNSWTIIYIQMENDDIYITPVEFLCTSLYRDQGFFHFINTLNSKQELVRNKSCDKTYFDKIGSN